MDMQEYAERLEESKGKLYKTAFFYLGDEDAAAEALDETIYRGLKGCRKLKEPEYFTTWMTKIVMNSCFDELKRRRRQIPYSELPESAAEVFDSLPLKEALRRLPKDLKDVVVLRYFSGFTTAETAEILGIPQGTAATRHRRALELLRIELKEETV